MIKGEATVQFGSGSVASVAGLVEDTGVGVICMRTTSPGKIGRTFPKGMYNTIINSPEVIIYFTNIESVDSMMTHLTHIRAEMIKYKDKETVRCKYHDPKMDELLSYCKRLYQLPGCAAGGCLHILLDDDNYDDHSLEFCRKYCEKNTQGEEHELAMKILDMYSAMSLTERTVFDWYWNGNPLECSDPTKCKTCDLCEIPDYMEEDDE